MRTFTIAWQADGQRQTYTVSAERRCLIGRQDRSCDIVLNAATVSRRHVAIEEVGGTFYLCNLSQTNSVHYNEQTRLGQNQRMALKPGDTFRLGSILFEVLRPTVKVLKFRCAHCGRIVDHTPEAFCPWCGRALSNAESVISEQ